jgi:hypothetical protein
MSSRQRSRNASGSGFVPRPQNHQAFAALPQSSMELLEISSINDSQLLKTKCYVQSQVCSSKPCGVEDGANQLFETAHRTATERVSTALQHR